MTTSSLENESIDPLSSYNEEQFLKTELKKTFINRENTQDNNLNNQTNQNKDVIISDTTSNTSEVIKKINQFNNNSTDDQNDKNNNVSNIPSSELVRISLSEADRIKAYEVARSYDIQYLQKLFQNDHYGFYWYSLIKFLSLRSHNLKAEDLELIKQNFSQANFNELDSNGKTSEFLNGLAYFLQNQTIFKKEEVLKIIQKISGHCFAYSLRLLEDATIKVFSEYRNQTSLSAYPGTFAYSLEQSNFFLFKKLINYSTDISFNHSEVLRKSWSEGFFVAHPEAFDFLIEKGCNVNDLEKQVDSDSWNIVHAMVIDNKIITNLKFDSFIQNFGNTINYDSLYCIYDTHKNLVFSQNVLNTLFISRTGKTIVSNLSTLDKFERLNSILKYSPLSEKHISQISSFIFDPSIIAEFYDHSVYENFFKNSGFNSELYDRKEMLTQLINLDHDNTIKKLKQENNYTVNPILILLNSFYKNSSKTNLQFSHHPFLIWGQRYDNLTMDSSSKIISNRNQVTAEYLIDKFKDDISHFSATQLLSLPSSLLSVLKQKGITVPFVEKKNFFQKIFNFKNNVHALPEETSSAPVAVKTETISQEIIPFSQELFVQIKDKDISFYLSAIELNVEQFSLLINPDISTNNSRYIQIVLPKLLNKTIENYLHFATMDLQEAKENVLIQLKLLNKKTFEVLKEGLEEEKENSARNGRVVTRIIKQS